MLNRRKGILLALAGAVLGSLIPIFGKIAVTLFSSVFAAFIVLAITAFFLGEHLETEKLIVIPAFDFFLRLCYKYQT